MGQVEKAAEGILLFIFVSRFLQQYGFCESSGKNLVSRGKFWSTEKDSESII